MVWHIGNTTVRTPYRLRDALVALQTSHLHGNLLGKENEQSFADLLHEEGLVRWQSPLETDRSGLGRKWRVALGQLGFLASHLSRGHRNGIDKKLKPIVEGVPGLTGRPYETTPAGRLLVDAKDMLSQQEAFLRALAAYRIPSLLEPRYKHSQFSPLHFILAVLRNLETLELESFISFEEMALIVQRSSADDGVLQVAESIRAMREARGSADVPLRQFYRQQYHQAVLADDPSTEPHQVRSRTSTLNDYADLSFRYLKATGLFRSRGRGITVSPERAEVVQNLREESLETLDDSSYLRQLWYGASIPTDERQTAVAVARSLEQTIRQKGVEPEICRLHLPGR